jgi:hypothetical protein
MSAPTTPEARKALALDLILDAWAAALQAGVEAEELASVAIFAALADMVDLHGEAAVAAFCAELPARVKAREFSVGRETE